MSDIKTLRDRLNKLLLGLDSISGRYRNLMPPGVTHALDAMRLEIDETQLLRRVVFRNHRKEIIALEVASGRVLRVSHPISECFQAILKDSVGQDVSRSTEGQISQLVRVLGIFCTDITELSVDVQILKSGATGPDIGISADALFQASGNSSPDPETPGSNEFLEGLIEDCAPISSAALLMVGDTFTVEYGAKAHLEALKTLALTERASNANCLQSPADSGRAGQCIMFSGHPDDGQAIVYASQTDSLALLFLTDDLLEEVLDFWTSRSN